MRIDLGDFEVVYELVGLADAPVVALGHCFAADRRLWDHQVPVLLAAGYRVLRHDARGHGESGTPAGWFSLSDMASDVVRLLDALELPRVHFCGISMSGMIGQHLGIDHGDRLHSLVLSNTCSVYTPAQRAGWSARFEQLAALGPAALLDEVTARWFAPDSLAREVHGVALMRAGFLAMADEVRLNIMTNLRDIDTTARLREITVPTLVIASENDLATPPDRSEMIHGEIAGAELVVLPDVGHIPPGECPEAFDTVLLDFLARQRG